jgi:adenylosuccinate lyase
MTHCARHEEYASPFSARYSSPEMSRLFSARAKAILFRKLWIALAKAQKKMGLPISEKQIKEMEGALNKIDFEKIQEYEKKFRHDVMAHIHAFGDECESAKPIIHLGATSSYAADNADLIQLKEALTLLFQKLLCVLEKLSDLADLHAKHPCLSYTHFQPAQPTTIGKRICMWLQDFLLDAKEWHRLIQEMPFLGAKGATGTQASFLALFEGAHAKVEKMEREISTEFGFDKLLPISGQTYTRKLDIHVLNALESFAASAHKLANDVRLLAHEGEFLEPFSETQVGSSAMPYKRNPIYCERICGLARFAISLSQNPSYTAATQWLERTLDDSSNRRFAIPESFLTIDAILNLLMYVLDKPEIHPEISRQRLEQNLPLFCMENILMESVKRGSSRQEIHEKLRKLTFESMEGEHPFEYLIHSIEKDKSFLLLREDIEKAADIKQLIGRAPEQVEAFLKEEVHPFLKKYPPAKIQLSPVEF